MAGKLKEIVTYLKTGASYGHDLCYFHCRIF